MVIKTTRIFEHCEILTLALLMTPKRFMLVQIVSLLSSLKKKRGVSMKISYLILLDTSRCVQIETLFFIITSHVRSEGQACLVLHFSAVKWPL